MNPEIMDVLARTRLAATRERSIARRRAGVRVVLRPAV